MEKIASDLKVTELKQSSICKAMEELHSQASSVLLITLQWKDLQQHLDSTRTELETLRQELAERDGRIGLREKESEAQRLKICSELQMKEKRLREVDGLVEARSREVEFKEKHIESLVVLILENCEELELKEKKFSALNASFRERERVFDQLGKSVAERKCRLDSLQRSVREAESKAKEVEKLRGLLRKYHDDIELKERTFNALRRSVEERKEEVELKEEQLRVYESAIDECEKEIKRKEEKLNLIQDSMKECSAELESKEKQLDSVRHELRLEEQRFASLRKSMEEGCKILETKEAAFKGSLEELGLKEKALKVKLAEVDVLYRRTNECVREVEWKEKDIDERCIELGAKEKQFESRVKKFELKMKEFEERSSREKTNMVRVKIEQTENDHDSSFASPASCSSIYRSCVSINGGNLQSLLYHHLKRHDLVCNEICASLNASSNPAKLVLDAIQGFYPSDKKDVDLATIRRSCILLLEQLMKNSSPMSDEVKEEAKKLAVDWKTKLKVEKEDPLEVLGFLQLLAVYELSSNFDADELRSLLHVVAHHRQAPVLRHVLGIANKAPVEVERAEYLPGNIATNSCPNFHSSPSKGGRSLHCLRNEHLSKDDLADKETLAGLPVSKDPAKFLLDMIGGAFRKYWKSPTNGSNIGVMRNCIAMFDYLMGISPQIGPSVKEDAMKLALEWEVKMRAIPENSFEILCFLQFLTVYGLISSFDRDNILKFLEKLSQHKEALELCTTLGFVDSIPELVQTLVERNQHLDAVRLICSYKLVNKISPAPLLKDYLDLVKNSARNIRRKKKSAVFKAKATEEEIAALRSAKQCIIDCNLQTSFPLINIDKRIDLLEKIAKERKSWTLSHASKPKVAPQEKRKIQITRTPDHNEQQRRQEDRNKCRRIALPISTSGYRGSSVVYGSPFPQVSSSNLHGAAMAANSLWQYNGYGSNVGAGRNGGLSYFYDTVPKHY